MIQERSGVGPVLGEVGLTELQRQRLRRVLEESFGRSSFTDPEKSVRPIQFKDRVSVVGEILELLAQTLRKRLALLAFNPEKRELRVRSLRSFEGKEPASEQGFGSRPGLPGRERKEEKQTARSLGFVQELEGDFLGLEGVANQGPGELTGKSGLFVCDSKELFLRSGGKTKDVLGTQGAAGRKRHSRMEVLLKFS